MFGGGETFRPHTTYLACMPLFALDNIDDNYNNFIIAYSRIQKAKASFICFTYIYLEVTEFFPYLLQHSNSYSIIGKNGISHP